MPAIWNPQANTVFLQALEQPPAEREAFLQQACDDRALAAQVRSLLAASEQAGSFLDAPLFKSVPTTDQSPPERPGTQIGPFKLLEEIGEGGMGTVFVAQQSEPLKRLVALKIIKAGMDSRQVIARFEAERQALALMDHPNIAKVLDGGTTAAGRPYFVMELVKGVPITQYCDQHHLTPKQRLELFVPVCQAIQHAHQKGIIHRDLKPSNVLIALFDDQPVPKVIDFGVAKATGQQLTEQTLHTALGTVVGTLEYMSPEQATFNQLDVDTRSDVYSLGILLYELLAGSPPFTRKELERAGKMDMFRVIREEEPAKPSTRLSSSNALPTLSANRGTEPARLRTLMRGELDWIVMKCLEKDRNRRYETAGAFAQDVHRYLADEPVQACPPSAWYRFGKFARRNRVALTTAATISAALVLSVASLVGAVSVLAASNADIKDKQQQAEKALGGEKNAKDELWDVLKREQRVLYLKRIALAERELAANNLGRLEEVLDECPLNLRGWEWRYLRRGRGPFTFQGHDSWVYGVAFSPNGKHVASASKTGEIKVWERATGNEVHRLLGHTASASAVAFRPDGKQLASAGWDNTVRIWDLQTGTQLHSLTDHREFVTAVVYSPDGKFLASASGDNLILIWDAVTLQKLHTLHGGTRAACNLAFAPDSRRLAASGLGETITVWDATSGQKLYAIAGDKRPFERVLFSPDGRNLVSAEFDGTVTFWDATNGQHRWILHADPGIVGLALSPDGKRLATGGFERPVHIWDVETGQEALVLRGHTEMILDLAFSTDGEQLASASMDGTVKIWDASITPARMEAEALTLRGFPAAVMSVAFHPDNKRLATASSETVQLWNSVTGTELTALSGPRGVAAGLVFSRDGRTLATATYGGLIKTWDVETSKEGRTFRGGSVALSPDGQRVAAATGGGYINIWSAASGAEELPPFRGHLASINNIAFSPDGQQLATASWDSTVKLWNAATGRELHTLRGHSHVVMHAAFSADNRRIATASCDKTAKIWDVATGEELLTIRGHDDRVIAVAFSPNGKLLATAGWDNTAKVWDAATGAEIETLRGHSGAVCCVAFSPDGKRLASGGGYIKRGEVKIWDTTRWETK